MGKDEEISDELIRMELESAFDEDVEENDDYDENEEEFEDEDDEEYDDEDEDDDEEYYESCEKTENIGSDLNINDDDDFELLEKIAIENNDKNKGFQLSAGNYKMSNESLAKILLSKK